MSPTPFPGLLMSDAPKSLAQLCHLQDSALAFLPSPRREGPLQACCALSGGVPRPASYPSRPPGDEDTSQLLTVQSSDQSRVLTTLASPTSPPQPFCSLKGCAGANFLRLSSGFCKSSLLPEDRPRLCGSRPPLVQMQPLS